MTDKELLQEALNQLEHYETKPEFNSNVNKTIDALRARLAQPEPLPTKSKGALSHEENKRHNQMIIDKFNAQQEKEPVAWWHDRGDVVDLNISGHGAPLYFAPPQHEWVGLTDEEIEDCLEMSIQGTCRAIEAKLKEKNT